MIGAPGIAPPFSLSDVPVAIVADADVVARLEQERSSMHDPDLQSTVRRRLEAAGRLLAHLERRDLTWPPPRRMRRTVNATISRAAWDELRSQAARLDVAEQVLLSGVLADNLFACPLAMIDRDEPLSGYLRTERGHGRIYGIQFEVTGFQYAFLKTLAGQSLTTREIFQLAVTSLAERLGRGDPPLGLPLSREALAMAAKVSLRAPGSSQSSPRS